MTVITYSLLGLVLIISYACRRLWLATSLETDLQKTRRLLREQDEFLSQVGQMKLTREAVEKLFSIVDLITSLYEAKADISNQIAIEIMGWYVDQNDIRRLWREASGQPVVWVLNGGCKVTLCQHPWKHKLNTDTDMSFSPVLNYHRRLIDWRAVVLARLS